MAIISAMLCMSMGFAYVPHTAVLKKSKTITVSAPNVESNKGLVIYSVYGGDGFESLSAQTKTDQVVGVNSQIIFRNVSPGEYAIVCCHDLNTNGRIDFHFNGLVLEDCVVSNNPISHGCSKYDGAISIVSENNVTLEIKI